MRVSVGARLGPFEILSPAGAGGMGEVWRARDTRLDRTVAIKVLPPDLTSDAAARQRFEREARAVAALSHPHICPLSTRGNGKCTSTPLCGPAVACACRPPAAANHAGRR
jgi:serine/threonine protein kinase